LETTNPLLADAKKPERRMRMKMAPTISHRSETANRAPAKCIATASGGWMTRKNPLPAVQEKCFFLTSPFIEPGRRSKSKGSFFFVFFVVLVDVFRIEFFAGIRFGAVETPVVGIADTVLGRQLVAVLGLRDRLDCVVGEYVEFSIDVLRGDLKGVEEEAGAAGVEFGGAEIAENPREGHPPAFKVPTFATMKL
jgi:hypothetical protein